MADHPHEHSGPRGDADAPDPAPGLALGAPGTKAADTYLRESTRLIRLQLEEMRESRSMAWLAHFSLAMKTAFEALIATVVLFVVVGIAAALWNAAHDQSLVIEPFSVPAAMAERGLTGHVVAAQVQDRLARLQAQTNSMRAASSYKNNWGDDIQVQIPDTGVSLGQINHYLHDWLGHRTYISGEIFRSGDALTVTARIGAEPAQSVSGKDGDLDTLLQKAAEAVYAKTQPYRYAVYLMTQNRLKEAAATFTGLAESGDAADRAWAYIGLQNLAQNRGQLRSALRFLDRALAARPGFALALINTDNLQSQLQHSEAAYRTEMKLARILDGPVEPDINPAAIETNRLFTDEELAAAKDDSVAALRVVHEILRRPDYAGSHSAAWRFAASAYAQLHDRAGLRHAISRIAPPATTNDRLNRDGSIFGADVLIGDWKAALVQGPKVEAAIKAFGPAGKIFRIRGFDSLTSFAMAMAGDVAGAKALIAKTPKDCDTCLRARARIAILSHDWKAAEHWASTCAARTPSLPQCELDWGDALRAKGDYDGAIAHYRIANARGPHFADPLEGWGEALIAKNRSDLALAKFEEAAKYAPKWGRLHLKWGEALLWTGRNDLALKQFQVAASLGLTDSEKSELKAMRKVVRGGGSQGT